MIQKTKLYIRTNESKHNSSIAMIQNTILQKGFNLKWAIQLEPNVKKGAAHWHKTRKGLC